MNVQDRDAIQQYTFSDVAWIEYKTFKQLFHVSILSRETIRHIYSKVAIVQFNFANARTYVGFIGNILAVYIIVRTRTGV